MHDAYNNVGASRAGDSRGPVRGGDGSDDLDGPKVTSCDKHRSVRIRDPNDCCLYAGKVEHLHTLDSCKIAFEVAKVGGNVREPLAGYCSRVVRSEIDEALKLRKSGVEVVIAERVGVEPHQSHRTDGRLILEEAGNRQRSPDCASGTQRECVGVCGAFLLEVGGQDSCASDLSAVYNQRIALAAPVRNA